MSELNQHQGQSPYTAPHATLATAGSLPNADLEYAGFWARHAALAIDCLILGILVCGLSMLVGVIVGTSASTTTALIANLVLLVLTLVFSWAYFSTQESGEHRATYGKRLFGMTVCTVNGERLSLARASGRWLAHALSNITQYIGYLIQPFTKQKQALHDLVCGTVVLRRKNSSAALVITINLLFYLVVGGIIALVVAILLPQYEAKKAAEKEAQEIVAHVQLFDTTAKQAATTIMAMTPELPADQPVFASLDSLQLPQAENIKYDYFSNGQNSVLQVTSTRKGFEGIYIGYRFPDGACFTNMPAKLGTIEKCELQTQ